MGTTLTSPTYYVSYSNVYASDSCGVLGTTVIDTVVAIPDEYTLSSLYITPVPGPHVEYWFTSTTSFNVTDLNEPVPYSIYTSQRKSSFRPSTTEH